MIRPFSGRSRRSTPRRFRSGRGVRCTNTTRLERGDAGLAEFPDCPESYLPGDAIPASLTPILALMARDYMPELLGIVDLVDAWIADHPALPAGTRFPASTQGMGTIAPLGRHRVTLRGVEIELAAQHYSIRMLQRVLDHDQTLGPGERKRADAILEATGLAPLFRVRPERRIERIGAAEVLGQVGPDASEHGRPRSENMDGPAKRARTRGTRALVAASR